MFHGKTAQEKISRKRNMARFFVKKRHVSWVLLIATCLWGVYGYLRMPHRKDPEFQVRTAVSLVPWPGASAEKVEQLVTKKVEEQIAANAKVTKIESISRTGLAVIYFELDENLKETGKEFDDIKLKLDAITDLPNGAGPINFIKDLRDIPALMLLRCAQRRSNPRSKQNARLRAVRTSRRGSHWSLRLRMLSTLV
jgi:multidrug efflux pump